MPREILLRPSAAALSTSMRDIGYTLETAIADLVDNSISAGAVKVNIYCISEDEEPVLSIVDDGHGMSSEEIIQAMRHGGTIRNRERSPHDLGKFGLGLKTASFSQCRRLTVVSRKNGQLSAAEWNLDVVDRRDEWIISILNEEEIYDLPCFDELPEQGTLVLWRNLDRISGDSAGVNQQQVNGKLADVSQHLALVFHRFMEKDVPWRSQRLKIFVNGHSIDAFDPFCSDHAATQNLPVDRISIKSHQIQIRGYILPHHSKLSAQKYDLYKDYSSFFENQGVYIYRNYRLVAWGGWLRLISKNKAAQLARVQIDFPSSLDHWWTIDIKKSSVQAPRNVRDHLRQILDQIIGRSKRTYTARGQRLTSDKNSYQLWNRFSDSTKGIRYIINTDHPLIKKLNQRLDQIGQSELKLLLESIGEDLPIEIVSLDWSEDPKKIHSLSRINESIEDRLEQFRQVLPENRCSDVEKFRELIRVTHLFDRHWEIVEEYLHRIYS